MKFKKILAGAVAAVVAVSSLSVMSFADPIQSGDWLYEYGYGDTIALHGYYGSDSNVVIPGELDGKVVAALYGTFMRDENIVTVKIPASISYMQGMAISHSHPFYEASKLVSITVDENSENYKSENGILYSKDMNTLLIYPAGKANTEYTVPDFVKTIEEGAFATSKLTSITIPDTVTYVGDGAFQDCTSLESITFLGIDTEIKDIFALIYGLYYLNLENITIYGYAGSTAETYAKENDINFVALDDENNGNNNAENNNAENDNAGNGSSNGNNGSNNSGEAANDPDKDSPSTGIEGVAVIAGLAIIASAALVISKKRK